MPRKHDGKKTMPAKTNRAAEIPAARFTPSLVGSDTPVRLRITRRRTLRHRMLLHRPDRFVSRCSVSADHQAGKQGKGK
jgi:hypothetical protein